MGILFWKKSKASKSQQSNTNSFVLTEEDPFRQPALKCLGPLFINDLEELLEQLAIRPLNADFKIPLPTKDVIARLEEENLYPLLDLTGLEGAAEADALLGMQYGAKLRQFLHSELDQMPLGNQQDQESRTSSQRKKLTDLLQREEDKLHADVVKACKNLCRDREADYISPISQNIEDRWKIYAGLKGLFHWRVRPE